MGFAYTYSPGDLDGLDGLDGPGGTGNDQVAGSDDDWGFDLDQYELAVTYEPSDGSMGHTWPDAHRFPPIVKMEGSSVTVIAVPNSGYQVKSATFNDKDASELSYVTESSVVGSTGQRVWFVGPFEADVDAHVVFEEVTEQPVPSSCPYDSNNTGPTELQIVGYTDGDIPASNCEMTGYDSAVWGGNFPGGGQNCEWSGCNTWDGSNYDDEIDDKECTSATVTLDEANQVWVMELNSAWPEIIWKGEKDTGDTPEGTYTYVDGCAGGPSTLELEEV